MLLVVLNNQRLAVGVDHLLDALGTADVALGLLVEQRLLNPVADEVVGVAEAVLIGKVKGQGTVDVLFIEELSVNLCNRLTTFVIHLRFTGD